MTNTVTEEVTMNNPAGLIGVALVVGFYVNRGQRSFSFLDSNKKAMKGEYLTPSKKPLLQKGMAAFPMSSGEQDQIYEFIKKYKSDVLKIVNGNVS